MKTGNSDSNAWLVVVETTLIGMVTLACYGWLARPGGLDPFAYDSRLLLNFLAIAGGILLGSLSVGLYNHKLRDSSRTLARRQFIALALAYFAVAGGLYSLFPGLVIHEHFILSVFVALLLLLVGLRYFAMKYHVIGIHKKRVVVLGAGERASIIEKRMRRKVDQLHFELLGCIPMPGDKPGGIRDPDKLLRIDPRELSRFVDENDVEEIVVACDERRGSLPVEAMFDCKIRGVDIIDVLDFVERESGQIAVTLIYPSWVIYSNGFETNNYIRVTLDYLFNFVLASLVFLLTWPIMLLTALAIWLDDGRRTGASVIYRQERVGLDGVPFQIMKFRSMRPDAEKDGARWAQRNDDRTTRIGAFIRKYRIDELPQLINVFKGEMGFVGPRPERPEFVKALIKEIPYYNQRHNVKPGLTGWAQLKYPYGSSTEDSLEKLKYDLYYIKHRSILMDLYILVRTVEIVLFGKGR